MTTPVTARTQGHPMTSPVAARPAPTAPFPAIPFGRLVRAEWRKATGTRAARWLLAAVALTTIGGLEIPLLFPHDVTQSRASYLAWAGLGLTRLLPIVLMLAMTAEWSQRTAMTTFTQEPRRGRVLAAKIATGMGISLAGAVYAFGVTELAVTGAQAAGRHIAVGWNWPQLAGFAVFVLTHQRHRHRLRRPAAQHRGRHRHLLRARWRLQPADDPGPASDRELGQHQPDLRLGALRAVGRPRRADRHFHAAVGRPATGRRDRADAAPRGALRNTRGSCRFWASCILARVQHLPTAVAGLNGNPRRDPSPTTGRSAPAARAVVGRCR